MTSEVTEDDKDAVAVLFWVYSLAKRCQSYAYDADGESLSGMQVPPLFISQISACPLAVYSSHFFREAICDLPGWIKSLWL